MDLLHVINALSFIMASLAEYTSINRDGHLSKTEIFCFPPFFCIYRFRLSLNLNKEPFAQMLQLQPNQTAMDFFYVINTSSFALAFLAE